MTLLDRIRFMLSGGDDVDEFNFMNNTINDIDTAIKILKSRKISKDFVHARKMVRDAIRNLPKNVTYEEALKQVQQFK